MKKYPTVSIILLASVLYLSPAASYAGAFKAPELTLAKVYKPTADVEQYWVSEKYDGVRAYWDGTRFLSRQGNEYTAPKWFTEGFPKHSLDGELWIARNTFEQLISTVTKDTPIDEEWQQVRFMVFELPNASGTFSSRLLELKSQLDAIENKHIQLVEQRRFASHHALMTALDQLVADGAEGLMIHHQNALYKTGRTKSLLKVKRHSDAEARVVKHLPGKGKYTGVLGALLLETPQGIRFRVGSGFSDDERRQPPAVGSEVTYKFYGKTRRGKPRFASFLRSIQ